MNLATLTASDLQIAGLTPMSSVDWPGKFVATVFAQGCPWACPYCHNQAIIDPKIPGVVSWERVEELLGRRRGLLDGVVFSGGEATRQLAVLPAMSRVRELGFEVGLHTAGPYPARLHEILRTGLVDWVGIDIKAMPGPHYEAVAGRPNAGPKAWESLGEVLDSGVSYEVRLTVYPDGPRDGYEVASCVKDLGATHFALQQARALGTAQGFNAGDAAWDLEVQSLADDIEKLGFESFQFRPA
jgi:anaerobic ribonucleoside-triphosphate reductase activating protein